MKISSDRLNPHLSSGSNITASSSPVNDCVMLERGKDEIRKVTLPQLAPGNLKTPFRETTNIRDGNAPVSCFRVVTVKEFCSPGRLQHATVSVVMLMIRRRVNEYLLVVLEFTNSLVRATEELLGRNSSGSGQENRD
jgi:hypothetical protein